jgi:outer membrane usher protein
MPINPTGRLIEMSVPLKMKEFYLGDISVRLTPQQEVEIPRAELKRLLADLLRANALAGLEASPGNAEHVYLSGLRQAGFDFQFDPASVSLQFKPTIEQKAQGSVAIKPRQDHVASPNLAEPALLSAYLNMRGAADYIARTPSGREGPTAPRLDLDGAARWLGVVLEAEATFEPDDASLFGDGGDGFKRRGTRLVRDFEAEAIRVTAGDVEPAGTSFQYTPDLLGIGIERSYAKLQPGRGIRATSRRSFRIERPSSVDVQVNGVTVRKLSLDAGDYDLSDLPVGLGLSDVVLLIEDDTGQRNQLEFSVFLDNELIEPGLSEWGLAAGVPTRLRHGEPDYGGEDYAATGFYRLGLLEKLTGEAHLQLDRDTAMGGLGFIVGTPLGLLSLEGAASITQAGAPGVAFDGQFAAASFEDGAGRRHALRFSARATSPDFTAAIPGDDGPGPEPEDGPDFGDWLALTASYGTELPFDIAAHLTAGYALSDGERGDGFQADLSLSRPLGGEMSLGLSGGYYARDYGAADLNVMASLAWRPDRRSSLTTRYESRGGRSGVSYDRRSEGHGVGSWQASIDLSREAPDAGGEEHVGVNGGVSYQANRAELALTQQSRLAGLDTDDIDQRTSLRIESALAFADGHLALGRPVSNGFAIVAPTAGLADSHVTVGGDGNGGGYAAATDLLGPALVPSVSPYTPNRIDFDVDALPPGYDLGDGLFDLSPKHRSGYALKVGSAYTVTALGTLIGSDGAPVALLTGTAREAAHPDKTVELFTNREGRFSAAGVAPGKWLIEVAGDPPAQFELDVPEGAVGLHRAGELRPVAAKGGRS